MLTIEEQLLKEFQLSMDKLIKDREQFITTAVLDSHSQYAESVGYLNGLKQAKEEFTRLKETFFPST